jgi:Yip1 domain
MTSDAAVLDGAGGAGLSQVERVVDTFVAPSKTFSDILRSSSWWLPFLLIVLFSVASAFVVGKQVGWDQVTANQIRQSPSAEDRLNQASPEQRVAQMNGMTIGYRYSVYATSVFVLLFIAIYAGILLASFNFGLGARATYGQVFAVCMYASLPLLVTTLLTIATLYFGGNVESYDFKDPVGTNLGYYMPDAAPWLRALLGQFDLIKLWSVVLTVLGMKIISKKSMGLSAAVVIGWWMVFLVVIVGLTAMFA